MYREREGGEKTINLNYILPGTTSRSSSPIGQIYTHMCRRATPGLCPGVAMWLVPIPIQRFIQLTFNWKDEEGSKFPPP